MGDIRVARSELGTRALAQYSKLFSPLLLGGRTISFLFAIAILARAIGAILIPIGSTRGSTIVALLFNLLLELFFGLILVWNAITIGTWAIGAILILVRFS